MRFAHVLRMVSDCTNGGVSSKRWIFKLITEEEETTLQTDKPEEYLVLVKRELWGKKAWYLRPLKILHQKGYLSPMHGGNYATIDYDLSRLPLPIHDRFETQREYDILSM